MITGELCTLCDGDGFMPNYIGSCPRCGGGGKEPMTTVTTQAGELNTFSSTELDAIESALSIAAQHYSTFADTLRRPPQTAQTDQFRAIFEQQAEEARALVLRIQANR